VTTEGELTIKNFLDVRTSVPVLKYPHNPLDSSEKIKSLGSEFAKAKTSFAQVELLNHPTCFAANVLFGDCRR
jgi:hypothetical protein